jgi:hypothetical protein
LVTGSIAAASCAIRSGASLELTRLILLVILTLFSAERPAQAQAAEQAHWMDAAADHAGPTSSAGRLQRRGGRRSAGGSRRRAGGRPAPVLPACGRGTGRAGPCQRAGPGRSAGAPPRAGRDGRLARRALRRACARARGARRIPAGSNAAAAAAAEQPRRIPAGRLSREQAGRAEAAAGRRLRGSAGRSAPSEQGGPAPRTHGRGSARAAQGRQVWNSEKNLA